MTEGMGTAVVLHEEQKMAMADLVQGVVMAGVFTEDIPHSTVEAACALSMGLGLDIVQGHVQVHMNNKNVGSKDKPRWVKVPSIFINGAGMATWAAKFPQYRGYQTRVLDVEEKKLWLITDPLAVEVTMYRDDWRGADGNMIPITGIGTANPADPYRSNPVEKTHPRDMAEWRGLRRVVQRAFPPDTRVGRALLSLADNMFTEIEVKQITAAAVEDVEAMPAPERVPDDIWRAFYVRMTEWGIPHGKVHDFLYEDGLTVDGQDPETGELTRSVRHTGLSPHDAAEVVRKVMVEKGLRDPAQPKMVVEPIA